MYLVGLDEVGRGCIAGSVIAAAVILLPDLEWQGELTDSKKLTPTKRTRLATLICEQSVAWAIGRAEATEIDRINILQASLLAMTRAVRALPVKPDRAVVDGNRYPALDCPGEAIIRGDALIPVISAASILAKVVRDQEMDVLDSLFPGYGFSRHKGYPTELHRQSLKTLGASPVHRMSFRPVRAVTLSINFAHDHD